jgi:hypothetical protein
MSDQHQITCEPCSICGNVGGRVEKGMKSPSRISLARYGLEGRGCVNCYNRLYLRLSKGQPLRREDTGFLPRQTHTPPCVLCGTTGGYRPKQSAVPARNVMKRWGIEGLACRVCYNRIRRRARQGKPIDPENLGRLKKAEGGSS